MRRLSWLVFWVSAAVLGFEISLMRLLLVSSWHHFAFIVIAIALLGFGASGTALTVGRRWVMPRAGSVLFTLALLTAVSMPLCTAAAQAAPVEARLAPALLWRQLGTWLIHWALLAVPFFFGAATIGLALMSTGTGVPRIYAANLIGSALGSLLAPAVMFAIAPEWLALAMAMPALLGAVAADRPSRRTRLAACGLCAAALGTWALIAPPHIRGDPYKYAAYLQRLEAQGSAERAARIVGPRAVAEVWRSDALHDIPFLAVGEAPPPISAIVLDGHWAGSVLDVADADAASVVDQTLMAFPYELTPDQPRVALLGEIGGSNVWLALRHHAAGIDVVQGHASVSTLLRDVLHDAGGAVLDAPAVRTITAEPRQFIEHTENTYDLIQLVTLESSAAGSGGVGGLGQDFLMTRQGIAACLDRLGVGGALFVCRGIQTPPRDNVKLLATFITALREIGVREPRRHIAIVRDYLAVCTIVRAAPLTEDEIDLLRTTCRQRQLTPVWWPGVREEELNRPDALPGPPDTAGDWYHFAALRLFSPEADRFIDDWEFDIRPPTDDRPFFADLGRIRAIGTLRQAYGDMWLTRTELAFLLVLAASIAISAIAAVLILLPLPFVRQVRLRSGGIAILVYFAAIGLAYMLLEMAFLSRLTLLVGDPVLSASVTIGGFLLASGAGSLTAQRMQGVQAGRVRLLLAAIVGLGLVELLLLGPLAALGGALPAGGRCALGLAVIAPLGFLMGFPMPLALARLQRHAAAALPWAWGVNGFASVLATPLSMVLAMSWGFSVGGAAAIGLYGAAAAVFSWLPRDGVKSPGEGGG